MEKLLIKYLLAEIISPNDVNIIQLENPLAQQIVRQILRLVRRTNKIPTTGDIISVLASTLGNSEARKCEVYLVACLEGESNIPAEEVLESLETNFILRQAEGYVHDIAELAISKDVSGLKSKIKELHDTVGATGAPKVTKLGEHIGTEIFMLPTALPSLNTVGARLTGLTVVGAPSGVGKSAFSANEVIDKWENGISSVYFSLELPAKLLEARILSNIAEVNLGDILRSLLPIDIREELSTEDQNKIDAAMRLLASSDTPDIYIYDNIFDAPTMVGLIRKHASDGVKLFVIDYLNLMEFTTSNGDASGWSGKAKFTRELNQLCLELGIIVILPTQVDLEKGTDGKLLMRTRGTQELLNSSSLALLIYKPPESEDMLLLSVTKARNAIPIDVALGNKLQYQKFVDMGRI